MTKTQRINQSIKSLLGYEESMPDDKFLKDWKRRSTQVCKPCWELKYCPYGPFVEQSPLLPPVRTDAVEHNEYISECLATDMLGVTQPLDEETRKDYIKIVKAAKQNPQILAQVVVRNTHMDTLLVDTESRGEDPNQIFEPPMSDFETYQVPWPLDQSCEKDRDVEITPEIQAAIEEYIKRMERAIATGIDDHRRPLDDARRKMFQTEVDSFDPDIYPESIPEEIVSTACNVFGHVCPVVFVGEAMTETSGKRRMGRYISFHVKMRVVRRDNYTCQECEKHLRDDEVEFDHVIPVSKGGSSEEHNIRLTCFDCNRSKSNTVKL